MLEERLHLMRHLDNNPSPDARAISDETLATYAPMAERMGLTDIQEELQYLSMICGYKDEYDEIAHLLQEAEASKMIVFNTFKVPICAMLDSLGIEYRFIHRMKSVYSIWKKMKMDHKMFDEIYDLFAARIIYKVPTEVKTLMELNGSDDILDPAPLPLTFLDAEKLTCWRIYTVITALYRVQPDRIKDWVTHPKPSGYRALQMTCMGPDCNWIEIQIRSEQMDYDAEHGIAAHWVYKKTRE